MKTRKLNHLLIKLLLSLIFLIWHSLVIAGPCDLTKPPLVSADVKLSIYLNDITEINDVKQEVTLDVYIVAEWEDKRVLKCSNFDKNKLWVPDLDIANRRSLALVTAPVIIVEDSQVRLRQHFMGTLAAPLNLRQFPMDRQQINIDIVSLNPTQLTKLTTDTHSTDRKNAFTIAGWQIGKGSVTETQRSIADGRSFPVASFRFKAERETAYYLWKIVMPLVVILFMSWGVLWISVTNVASKIAVSTTAVLTLFAYHLSLTNTLPKLAYLTRMDIFVAGAFIIVLFGFLQTLISVRLAELYGTERSERLDKFYRWLFPLLFTPVVIFAFFL